MRRSRRAFQPGLWTDERLKNCYELYRKRYWPRSLRLRRFRVVNAPLTDCVGICENDQDRIVVDVTQHGSDREVRQTLLHEMIHAVLGRRGHGRRGFGGHGTPFWEQMERLLSLKAPISVSFPEFGLGHRGHPWVIPMRFKRCRKAFAPAYRRWQHQFEKLHANVTEQRLTADDLEQEAHAAARGGISWRVIWATMSGRWGLVDLDGRIFPRSRKEHLAARRGYVRGRRFFLEDKRHTERWQAMRGSPHGE